MTLDCVRWTAETFVESSLSLKMATIRMAGSYFYLLLCFVTPAASFHFTKTPAKPLVVYYKNRTNVQLRWEWTHPAGEVLSLIKIKRYRKGIANTETTLATYFSSASQNVDTTKYSFTVVNNVNGYASFVIKDITNQGGINVMAENEVYIYKIVVDEQTDAKEYTDEVELKTLKTPSITTYPKNQTASGGTVTFECAADGKPTPIITWEKIGSSQLFSQGSPLTITTFDAIKVGVYRCTAKSAGIAENATGTGYVQFSTCGAGCTKEELGIEFTELTYNYEYENPSYNKYKELKRKIEVECLIIYAKSGKAIRKCEVKRFRKGSVVAVVELGWNTNTVGPKQPLLQAISDGNFAGYKVNTDFVSPTSSPTQIPTSIQTHIPTSSPKYIPKSSTPKSTTPKESAATCSTAKALCVTIIVILVISNAVLGFLLWKKNSELREVFSTKNLAQMEPNEHPLTASNGGHMAVMENRQREIPTAPIYHEIHNVSNSSAEPPSQPYQTLDANHMNARAQSGGSSVPCSDQPQCQTYQTLDDATKNVNNPVETSVPENYQALQDVMPPANYSKLNKVV